MASQKSIVLTSINEITKGVEKFLEFNDWDVIFVGDRITPDIDDSAHDNLTYMSIDDQEALSSELADILPYDHYGRKNLGYIAAFDRGCEFIAETDDDNLPKDDWDKWLFETDEVEVISGPVYPNVYRQFTDENIWPRGYPLVEVTTDDDVTSDRVSLEEIDPGVVNGLADKEPDVDAIYRLTVGDLVYFDEREPVSIDDGVYCPFNSQNTLWFPETYAYMYLPTTVTYRFTDILRSFIAERGFHAMGKQTVFTEATVVQERNPHDLMADFEAEIGCYTQTENVIETLESLNLTGDPTSDLTTMYDALYEQDIVDEPELDRVEAWTADIESYL